MKDSIYEIERKYLIRYPDMDLLNSRAEKTEITQTYLKTRDGRTERVRKRGFDGAYVYTHTQKTRISDVKRIELEREISEEEYTRLLEDADPARSVIHKDRYCLAYREQMFEIDVYPFWNDRAIMEIELDDEGQEIIFPPEIQIIREVTSDKRYTNSSLAKQVPYDSI
ncbi:MAG: CYTH domain-containing protein [Candidatus Limivicinus sp.]